MSSLLGSVGGKLFTFAILLVALNVILCINEEVDKDYAAELISECGYPFEIHRNIRTEDGYLLTSQRIPSRGKEYSKDEASIPVLLMHGMLGSSDHFLLNCTQSLGFMLADQGYDVWLGNVRTVSYSRHHVSLDPDSPEYWNITLNDFGNYDLPALIDYILETTGHRQIMYIGHSQGNMIFYIMCSNKPEYADKVQLFVNLSPVATLNSFPHPWVKKACSYSSSIESVVNRFGIYEWTLGRNLIRQYGGMMCKIMPKLCNYIVYVFSGYPPSRLPSDQFQNLLKNCPEGISAKQFIHACQMINKESFAQWDYGNPEDNIVHYGLEEPPSYNLSMTTTPIAIYYCQNDWFLSYHEALKMIKILPNVVDNYEISFDDFSHFDFIIGHLAPKHLYPRIIRLMNKFRSKQKLQFTVNRGWIIKLE